MFPRPEVIPSMRLIRQTPTERLQTMRETASNAQQAEALLRCLVVFQGPFLHTAASHLRPEGMDGATCHEALRTLVHWNVVQPSSKRRYIIPESLKKLFPLTREVIIRHITYCLTRIRRRDSGYLEEYWSDISFALARTLEYNAILVHDLCQRIANHDLNPRSVLYWPLVLDFIEREARQRNYIYLQALVLHQRGIHADRQKDSAAAKDYLMKALTLTIHLRYRMGQAPLYAFLGRLAIKEKNISQARDYLYRAISLYGLAHREAPNLWYSIFYMEIDQRNMAGAHHSMTHLLPRAQRHQLPHILTSIAWLYRRNRRYDEARGAFAMSLTQLEPQLWTRETQMNTLKTWAEMEHQIGNLREAHQLCQQALILAEALVESGERYHNAPQPIRDLLAKINYEEA